MQNDDFSILTGIDFTNPYEASARIDVKPGLTRAEYDAGEEYLVKEPIKRFADTIVAEGRKLALQKIAEGQAESAVTIAMLAAQTAEGIGLEHLHDAEPAMGAQRSPHAGIHLYFGRSQHDPEDKGHFYVVLSTAAFPEIVPNATVHKTPEEKAVAAIVDKVAREQFPAITKELERRVNQKIEGVERNGIKGWEKY